MENLLQDHNTTKCLKMQALTGRKVWGDHNRKGELEESSFFLLPLKPATQGMKKVFDAWMKNYEE